MKLQAEYNDEATLVTITRRINYNTTTIETIICNTLDELREVWRSLADKAYYNIESRSISSILRRRKHQDAYRKRRLKCRNTRFRK